MKTIIKNSIFRITGKSPEGLDDELINAIVKNASSFFEALVNLIIFTADWNLFPERFAANKIAVLIIDKFKEGLDGVVDTESQEMLSLSVITAFFANPKLLTIAMLKIMLEKEKAI